MAGRKTFLSLALAPILAVVERPRIALADDPPIRLALSPAVTGALSYFGQELGFFKRAGLNVELQMFGKGTLAFQSVITGAADFGQAVPIPLALAMARDISVAMVGVGSLYVAGRKNIVGLYVAKDSPIRGAADLVGKTIGVSTLVDNSILGVDAWLDKNGVDRTLVKAVEIPFAEMGAALERGTVAAAIIAEPFLSAAKDQTREIPRMFDAIGPRWAIEVWYGRREFLKANPGLTKRFMDAVYATSKFVNANPDRIVSLLSAYSKIPVERLADMAKPIFSESFDPSLVQAELDLSYKYKQLAKPVKVAELMQVS